MPRPVDELKALLISGDIDGFEERLSSPCVSHVFRHEFVDLIPMASVMKDWGRREALVERLVDLASTAHVAPSSEGLDIRRSVLARAVASGFVTDAVMKFFERQPGDLDETLKLLDLSLMAGAVQILGPRQAQSALLLLPGRDNAYIARFADAVGNSGLAQSVRALGESQSAPAAVRSRGPSMAGPRRSLRQ